MKTLLSVNRREEGGSKKTGFGTVFGIGFLGMFEGFGSFNGFLGVFRVWTPLMISKGYCLGAFNCL